MVWTRKPRAFVDTETSGLDYLLHEVTAFGGIKEYRKWWFFTRLEFLDIKIKMEFPDIADPKALEIQGYTEDGWKDALSKEKAFILIREFLSDCSFFVAHNAPFDWGFLQSMSDEHQGRLREQFPEMKEQQNRRAGLRYLHKIDTITLAAEHLVPCGIQRLGLGHLCEFLGIKNSNAHTALADAEACRQLYHTLERASCLKRLWWAMKFKLILWKQRLSQAWSKSPTAEV